MKKIVCLAVAPLIFLSACATVETSLNGGPAQAPVSDAMYCWKDRLQSSSDALTCNWAASTAEACKETKSSALAKSAIASGPNNARRCDNGQWLVQVSRR